MSYITISKLQSKLGGEANQTAVRKLMDEMTKEGYIESTNNRRLGKRVIHSDLTKKLAEVRKALDVDPMVEDKNETHNKSNHLENQTGFILKVTTLKGKRRHKRSFLPITILTCQILLWLLHLYKMSLITVWEKYYQFC